ncbi:hypothetical protein SAMN06265218_1177 [Fodinibius sediminis]|uniref:Uncharacterized protein n=1 Tax=Fodinibius sediminis TaxID=1214077 RepID=A0A521EK78_9BACT|nr:hypothetical protein SAMN06265218_1177 [Fodinibius sediminis]
MQIKRPNDDWRITGARIFVKLATNERRGLKPREAENWRGVSALMRWIYGGSCVKMYYTMLAICCFFVCRFIVKCYCTTTKGFSFYEFKNSPVIYIFK